MQCLRITLLPRCGSRSRLPGCPTTAYHLALAAVLVEWARGGTRPVTQPPPPPEWAQDITEASVLQCTSNALKSNISIDFQSVLVLYTRTYLSQHLVYLPILHTTQHHEFAAALLRPTAPAGVPGRSSPHWIPSGVVKPRCTIPIPAPWAGSVPAVSTRLSGAASWCAARSVPIAPTRPARAIPESTVPTVRAAAAPNCPIWAATPPKRPIWAAASPKCPIRSTGPSECPVWAAGPSQCPIWTTAPSECAVWATASSECAVWATAPSCSGPIRRTTSVWPASNELRPAAAARLSCKYPRAQTPLKRVPSQ